MSKCWIYLMVCFMTAVVMGQTGFALELDFEHVLKEEEIIEGTMQLWGFVDLLDVVAITPEDLEHIVRRCAGYILELYVQMRLQAHKPQVPQELRECIAIFKDCCARLAALEERQSKACGVFCTMLRGMQMRTPNIPICTQEHRSPEQY